MEDMGSIFMDIYTFDLFRIYITCDMISFVYDKDLLTLIGKLPCTHGTIQSRSDYKIIIHMPTKPP